MRALIWSGQARLTTRQSWETHFSVGYYVEGLGAGGPLWGPGPGHSCQGPRVSWQFWIRPDSHTHRPHPLGLQSLSLQAQL